MKKSDNFFEDGLAEILSCSPAISLDNNKISLDNNQKEEEPLRIPTFQNKPAPPFLSTIIRIAAAFIVLVLLIGYATNIFVR